MRKEILRLQNVSIASDSGSGLRDICLYLYTGESLGVVGPQYSGKSSLLDVIDGSRRAEKGKFFFRGASFDAGGWKGAENIRRVRKTSALVEYRTVLENIFVIKKKQVRRNLIRWKNLRKQAVLCLKEFEIPISPEKKVYELAYVEHHMVELLKDYLSGAELILMDVVTAKYTAADYVSLYRVIRKMQDKGVAFIISGYRMDDLQRLTDRCLFMVKGQAVKVVENIRRWQIDETRVYLSNSSATASRNGFVYDRKEENNRISPQVMRRVDFQMEGKEKWNFQIAPGEITVFIDPFRQYERDFVRALQGDGIFLIDGKEVNKGRKKEVYLADFLNDKKVLENLTLGDNLWFPNHSAVYTLGFLNPFKYNAVKRLFLEQYQGDERFRFQWKQLSYAEQMAVYLERLKLQKWKLLFCMNVDAVLNSEQEEMIKIQLRKMAESRRSVCVCTSAFMQFADTADSFFMVTEEKGFCKYTYRELCTYFGI